VCSLPEEVKARYDRSSIRTIFAGAARWPYALKLKYRNDFPEDTLWEIYGSSETGSVTVVRPEQHWDKPESCGKPVPGVVVVLIGEDGEPITEPHREGLLYCKSDNLFIGYEGDEEAYQSACWGDGYITVGDVAYFDQDGFYYICDRAKDMIVSGGVNVYPAEVETVLDRCPGVGESAVFGIPDDKWGEVIHAVIVRELGEASPTESEVIDHCRKFMAAYKVPRSIEFAGDLPRTAVGKIRKAELRQRHWAAVGRRI